MSLHKLANIRHYQKPEAKQHRREYQRKWRVKNLEKTRESNRRTKEKYREKYNLRNKERFRLLRQKVLEKLGGKCVYCGCDNPHALEINHMNGNGLFEYRTKGSWRIQKEILEGTYPHPVKLVCRVCNAIYYLKMRGIAGFKVVWNVN